MFKKNIRLTNSFLALLLLLITVVPVNSSFACDWRVFKLESAPGFVVQGDVKGKLCITGKTATIIFDSTKIRMHPKIKESSQVTGIKIGLAYEYKPNEWDFVNLSQLIPIQKKVPIPDGLDLGKIEAEVELSTTKMKKRNWVVMQMHLGDGPNNTGSRTYAHEPGTPTQ